MAAHRKLKAELLHDPAILLLVYFQSTVAGTEAGYRPREASGSWVHLLTRERGLVNTASHHHPHQRHMYCSINTAAPPPPHCHGFFWPL